jgi:hypothetical protein
MMKIDHKKTFGYIINIYFHFKKTLDKVYDDFKDWDWMFSNKFDVKFVYAFKVGIIKNTFKNIFIGGYIFFQNFWRVLCYLLISLNLYFFSFFPQQELAS